MIKTPFPIDIKIVWLVVLGVTMLASFVQAEVSPPSWSGEANTVRHLYLFLTDSESPTPDESSNLFGSPTADVWTNNPTASGWLHDNANPGHYFWDLGATGTVHVTIPIGDMSATPGFAGYDVEIQVNVVAYHFFTYQMPSLSADGNTLQNVTFTESTAYGTGMDVWENRTWTAKIEAVMEDMVTLVVRADEMGSRVESLEIFAMAVPRPLEVTQQGTPFAWFQAFGIERGPKQDWDDLDYEDSDGDGMLNGQEYVAGTDPTDFESLLKIVGVRAVSGQSPRIDWIGGTNGPGAPYLIESTPSLRVPVWTLEAFTDRVEGTNRWTGEAPLENTRFYRVRATGDDE